MKSRFKATILIGLCILMQAISVYPHHHHGDALCTEHDMKAASPVGSSRSCTAVCITHFSLTLPATGISVNSRQFVRCLKDSARPDQAVFAVQAWRDGHGKRQERRTPFYASPPAGGAALRAPPFCLFLSDDKE